MVDKQDRNQWTACRFFSLYKSIPIRDIWLWIIILTQSIVNLFFLPKRTLWLDEAYSALLAQRSISEIHQALRFDASPPLYYDLLHIWRSTFGESELALRSLSLVATVLGTVTVYRFACRFWNRETGGTVACLFAFSPLTVLYSQEARNYTLLAALSLGFGCTLIQFLSQGGKKSLAVCGLCALALVYTHNTGWFLIAAGGISALVLTREWRRLLPLIEWAIVLILLYLPWIPTLLTQVQNSERTIAWIRAFWSPWSIAGTFSVFIPGGFNPSYLQLPVFPFYVQAVNAILFFIAFSLSCIAAWRNRDKKVLAVIVFLVGGLLGPYLYSLKQAPLYLAGRTDFGLFPYWCLLVGYGFCQIPWRAARLSLLIVFIGMAGIIDARLLINDDPVSERDGILYLQKQTKPGDIILCTGLSRPSFEYALYDRVLTFRSFPRDMEIHLAHLNEAWYDRHIDGQKEAESVLKEAIQSLLPNTQLWVIYSQRVINEPLYDLLANGKYGRITASVSSPRLGLRRLGEPIIILRVEPLANR